MKTRMKGEVFGSILEIESPSDIPTVPGDYQCEVTFETTYQDEPIVLWSQSKLAAISHVDDGKT